MIFYSVCKQTAVRHLWAIDEYVFGLFRCHFTDLGRRRINICLPRVFLLVGMRKRMEIRISIFSLKEKRKEENGRGGHRDGTAKIEGIKKGVCRKSRGADIPESNGKRQRH